MKTCENCKNQHNGEYGSGRFCSSKCARGFSTKSKRQEINQKVSESLKGKSYSTENHFTPFNSEIGKRGGLSLAKKNRQQWESDKIFMEFSKLVSKYSLRRAKQILLEEQNFECDECNISKWNGKEIVLEVHHKDGNNKNNSRENLCCLCPNCHSQTDNFRSKNRRTV